MFPLSVSQAAVGFKTPFSLLHLSKCMGSLDVVRVFTEVGSRREIFLAFLMGSLVDISDYQFQCVNHGVGDCKGAT